MCVSLVTAIISPGVVILLNNIFWKINISNQVGWNCITVAQTFKGQFTTKLI